MQPDLFDFARDRADLGAAPAAPAGEAWEEPVATLWGRAWLANVRRLCTPKYASELAFAEKLLRNGKLRACRVRGSHAQATFTNLAGGQVLVNLEVAPLGTRRWQALERLCDDCGDALFSSDDLADDVVAKLFGRPDGLLPELGDLAFDCSHCSQSRAPFCLYRAATLLAVAAEFDCKPVKLFELRGAGRELLFARAAQQSGDAGERLAEDALPELFGIELA